MNTFPFDQHPLQTSQLFIFHPTFASLGDSSQSTRKGTRRKKEKKKKLRISSSLSHQNIQCTSEGNTVAVVVAGQAVVGVGPSECACRRIATV